MPVKKEFNGQFRLADTHYGAFWNQVRGMHGIVLKSNVLTKTEWGAYVRVPVRRRLCGAEGYVLSSQWSVECCAL